MKACMALREEADAESAEGILRSHSNFTMLFPYNSASACVAEAIALTNYMYNFQEQDFGFIARLLVWCCDWSDFSLIHKFIYSE